MFVDGTGTAVSAGARGDADPAEAHGLPRGSEWHRGNHHPEQETRKKLATGDGGHYGYIMVRVRGARNVEVDQIRVGTHARNAGVGIRSRD